MSEIRVTPQRLWQIVARPMNDAQQRAVGDACKALTSQNPSSPKAWALYGFYHTRLGRHAEALPLLERAQSLQPQLGSVLHALALTYVGLGRHAEAEPMLRALLAQSAKTAR